MASVMPFMLKGMLTGNSKPSPFFGADGVTPVAPVTVLSKAQREAARP